MNADEITTRAFILQRQIIQETHKTRDPLEGIDRIYVPPGANHDWGEQKDPARRDKVSTDTIMDIKKGNESGPSDSDERLESQEGNPPTKPDTEGIKELQEGEKFERCVSDVKAKGSADNPYAVCHSSLG